MANRNTTHDFVTRPGSSISRRDFGRLVGAFGLSATAAAMATYGGSGGIVGLAKAAEAKAEVEARKKKYADMTIRMGISGHTGETDRLMPGGPFDFKRDLEDRTGGAITVELHGGNSVCTELTCIQKVMSGTIPAGYSSTQNAAQTIPFLNLLDFPYLWPSMASQYHFLYSRKGNELFRDIMREKFNVETIFSLNELRSVFLSNKWGDAGRVASPDQVDGAKIRVTGSALGTLGLKLMGMAPIPLGWSETLEGLKSGVVDGMETSAMAAAAFGMTKFVSHDLRLEFFPIFEMAFIDRRVMDRLSSEVQEAILESAYHTQAQIQFRGAYALENLVGALSSPPPKSSRYADDNVQVDSLTDEEKQVWIDMASPKANPKPYDKWMSKVDDLAGRSGMYDAIHEAAREVPEGASVYDIKPRRWWLA
jgi:TRAP-type C4-dicarboxylate transport system substrate-binding protein